MDDLKSDRLILPPNEPHTLRPILHARPERFSPIRALPRDEHFRARVSLPLEMIRELRPETPLDGFRPAKAEAFFQPRVGPVPRGRKLERFNGKKVRLSNETWIYGGENRKILYDRSWPWRCVGRFWHDSAGGSGALVGRRLVLTAAHCIPWSSLWSSDINFSPAYVRTGSTLGASYDAKVNAVAYWDKATSVCGYDMAVCRLDKPLGDSLGYFGARGYIDDWEDLAVFSSVGYPYDIAGGLEPVVEQHIAVEDDDGDSYGTLEVEAKADNASGMSGGPLFATWGSDVQIVGARSGRENEFTYTFPFGFTDDHTVFAGGNGLVSLIRWARDNWDT